MLIVFAILIILSSIILGVIILIQNPKGGGLNSSISSVGNQLMGVKQTTDVLEKGTWVFAAIIGVLCLTSTLFIPDAATGTNSRDRLIQQAPAGTPATANPNVTAPVTPQAQPAPAPATPQP